MRGLRLLGLALSGFLGGAQPALAAQAPFHSILNDFQLQGGMSAGDYAALRARAYRLMDEQRWAEAASAFRQLVSAYSRDGDTYRNLGLALAQLGDDAGAASAFDRAHELGLSHEGADNAADAARAWARLGEAGKASQWLRTSIDLKQRDPDSLLAEPVFDNIRLSPEFQALLATRRAAPAGTRDQKVAADIDYFMEKYRSYEAGKLPASDWARFEAAAESFKKRVPSLTDGQIVGEFHKLIVMAGLGHNGLGSIYIGKGMDGAPLKALPIDFYLFPEGLYVTGTTDGRDDLAGAKVLAIGGVPTEEALRRADAIVDHEGNSDMTFAWQAPRAFAQPELLETIGLLPNRDHADITILDATGKTRTVSLPLVAFRRTGKLYAPKVQGRAAPTPLYLSRVNDSFWFTDISRDTVYFQYNGIDWKNENAQRPEAVNDFAKRLSAHLRTTGARNLIVDVRLNNGGDTYSYIEVLRTLVGFDTQPGHRLFLITGRDTYSAAENFSVDVSRLTHATLVGEPGSKPRATGDPVWITLPYTQLRAYVASGTWALFSPFDRRRWLPVQMPVVLKAGDYFAGRDPALDAIFAVLRNDHHSKMR